MRERRGKMGSKLPSGLFGRYELHRFYISWTGAYGENKSLDAAESISMET